MTVLWLLINLWPSIVLICVDFREGENRGNHRRDQLRELSNMKCHTRLGFSGERHNALTARATLTFQVVAPKYHIYFQC